MKKIIFISLSIFFSLISTSCSSDDDSSNTPSIIGKWELISSVIDNQEERFECPGLRTFEFTASELIIIQPEEVSFRQNAEDPGTITCINGEVSETRIDYSISNNQIQTTNIEGTTRTVGFSVNNPNLTLTFTSLKKTQIFKRL